MLAVVVEERPPWTLVNDRYDIGTACSSPWVWTVEMRGGRSQRAWAEGVAVNPGRWRWLQGCVALSSIVRGQKRVRDVRENGNEK
jgi:hypothetical protein